MPGRCIHHVFQEQAALTPDAVAAVWDGGTLTYRELDERADRFADLLAAGGVGPERLVGVVMDPSPQLLITMLAVWKAGGVYVPVDPSLPRDVAETMLLDAGAVALVRGPGVTVEPDGVRTLDVDQLDLADGPVRRPDPALHPANLAYCVFTSGSTGKPKPVAVQHASFVNHAFSLRDRLRLVATDRVLQSTAIAFDAALEEILPAWAAGAAVAMPDQRRFTPLEFTGLISRLAVTMVSLPSAYWHQWVDDLSAGLVTLPPTLRVVFIGGDKILVEKLEAWARVPGASAVDWISDYGPTETTISVALHRPDDRPPVPDDDYALVPIGLPFAGAVISIRDSELRPVPDGVPGDLFVAGPPLARGYHGSPAATADRFLPDPDGEPGSRMYRTGDRASRRPDGTLIFLGRSDRQVKVRGQRVEPGQVESAVHGCEGVRDAVVIAVDDPPFGSRLVAYVEAEPGVSEAAIRADVANRLPEAMVPQTIVLMDHIPRSPLNGKVSRSALPPVAPSRSGRAGTAAATTLERVLASLAGEVLGVPDLDRDEDFFAAGGDSLRAFQLLSRITEVTGVAVPFARFRAAPQVAGIAELVKREHGRGHADGAIVPTVRHGDRILASPGQQALWFMDRVDRGAPTYTLPICYRIRGPLDLDRLDAALTAIVARHEALRTVFELHDGKVWQRVGPAGPVRTVLTVVADEEEAARKAGQEAGRSADMTAGPLLRSTCFRISAEEHLWLLTVHHSAFDDWSLAVFWRELAALYTGRPLPEPPTQYADYSIWQEGWLRGAEAEKQRSYWRDQLAGDIPVAVPGLREAGTRPSTAGFAMELPPDAIDAKAVESVARECGTTVAAVLLAAQFTVLRRTSGVDDAVIGVPAACRNRPGTEDLIGYLVNTVAVRMRFPAGMRFRELIARTDEAMVEALTNQDLPFVDVVAGLERRGAPGESPLFQTMFALQTTSVDGIDDLDGLSVTDYFVHSGTSKAAINWTVRQNVDSWAGDLEFSSDRFDEPAAREWSDALLTLLAAGLADPDTPIDELPLR